MAMRPILTVGHSNLEAQEFIELLKGQAVELLVDVRRFPGSKHVPWTKSGTLEKLLEEAGIHYLHLESIGGRRRSTAGSRNGGWRVRQFQGYADHMCSAEFGDGLARLEDESSRRRLAIMCAEPQWWRCHRRLIADRLLIGGDSSLTYPPSEETGDHSKIDDATSQGR